MRSRPRSRVLGTLLAVLASGATASACAAGSHHGRTTGSRAGRTSGSPAPSTVGSPGASAPIATAGGAGVKVSPRVGSPGTRFRVAFTAPARTGTSGGEFRTDAVTASEAHPRRGCTAAVDVPVQVARAGERVTVTLAPPSRSRWCAGTYRGRVDTLSRPVCTPGMACPQFVALRPIGSFRFTVRRG